MDVRKIILTSGSNVRSALSLLDSTGLGTIFIVDENIKLLGVLTDGDIRRAILSDKDLDTVVDTIMNTDFKALPISSDNSVILEAISNSVKIIPLVDADNTLLDYASIRKIRNISIASPLLDGNELAYVTECIKTNWISSQGKYVKEFETQFSDYHHGKSAVAVSNGTVALHLALEALGIGKGDEVIVPDLTFAASVNAIIYTGATPVLIDIDPQTWNIDISMIPAKITSRTKAIMPVHLYGNPCNMQEIMEIADKHNLLVVEDCAEALGSYSNEQGVGNFGDAATYSFYGNKTITTGEGGMVIFKDPAIANRALILRDHGMEKTKRYWHAEVGYNYRLTNLQAALGVAQFERLNEFIVAKRKIAKFYNGVLQKFPFYQIPQELEGDKNSYWLYTFLIESSAPFNRDELMSYLGLNAIETRPVFYPMHQMPPYTGFGKSEELQVSISVSERGMSLPSSANLSQSEMEHIGRELVKFSEKYV